MYSTASQMSSQGSNSEECPHCLSLFILKVISEGRILNAFVFIGLARSPTNYEYILFKSMIAGTKSSSGEEKEKKEDRCSVCLTG